jgi:hypothetical protein
MATFWFIVNVLAVVGWGMTTYNVWKVMAPFDKCYAFLAALASVNMGFEALQLVLKSLGM